MDTVLKVLLLLLLFPILLSISGCATSSEDLNYERKTVDTSGDSSYHGWAAPPRETNPQ